MPLSRKEKIQEPRKSKREEEEKNQKSKGSRWLVQIPYKNLIERFDRQQSRSLIHMQKLVVTQYKHLLI